MAIGELSVWCGCMLSTSLSRQKLKQNVWIMISATTRERKRVITFSHSLSSTIPMIPQSNIWLSIRASLLWLFDYSSSLKPNYPFYNHITYINCAYIAYNAEVPTCTTTFTFIHLFRLLFYRIYTHPHPYLFTSFTPHRTMGSSFNN